MIKAGENCICLLDWQCLSNVRFKADSLSWAQTRNENSCVVCTFTEFHGNKTIWNEAAIMMLFNVNSLTDPGVKLGFQQRELMRSREAWRVEGMGNS